MKRTRIAVATAAIILAAVQVAAETSSIPSYYSRLKYNITSPSAWSAATGGYHNPAVYRTLEGTEINYTWSDKGNRFTSMDEWGLFWGAKHIGFGVVRNEIPVGPGVDAGVNDLRLALSFGNRNTTVGYGFGWTTGDKELVGRSNIFQAGLVHRFGRYVSMGLVGTFAIQNSNQQGLLDVAVRPFGTPMVTVFADGELPKGVRIEDAPWSAGAIVEPVPGMQFVGRYFEDESFALSVGLGFGTLGLSGTPSYDKDGGTINTSYSIRSGYTKRSFLEQAVTKDSNYLRMKMKGTVTYRGYKYFDPESHPLKQILADLEHAKNDPAIRGVAIDIGGMRISRGKAWEIREKLAELQDEGKHVVIFVEDLGMTEYHLASVADRIVMDSEGMVLIPGYVMGRTFIRNMLTKMGLGFEEWRYFTYKSANEALARTDMSEADKEQRLAIIEDLFAVVRADMAEGRNVSEATVDRWINEDIFMSVHEAKEFGIIDDIGRWDDVSDVIEELEGDEKHYVSREDLAGNRYATELWGENPKVAVVYALGVCAMDSGIHARRLEKILRKIARKRDIDAVVLRVDSPGGSSMASDVVAVQLKKIAKKKPVIISQGDVAASGGYWLSMYGDSIFAQPAGIGEKIGHTSDHVKVGEKADYGFGFRFLLFGPQLPRQKLPEEDMKRVKTAMLDFYGLFLDKVSEGRGIPRDQVDRVAQGRVFSGIDGIEAGLVDEIGGLDAAITAARRAAGIADGEPFDVVEYPELPSFNPRIFSRYPGVSWFGLKWDVPMDVEVPEGLEWAYLKAISEHPGRPLVMLPPEYYIEESGPTDR
jgi:protease-4